MVVWLGRSCWPRASAARAAPAGGRSGTSPTGVAGCTPVVKHSSAHVHVADAGQVALVEQRLADRPVGLGAQVGAAPRSSSQSGPSRSGPRWPTSVVLVLAGTSSTMPSEKPTAPRAAVPSTTRAWWVGPRHRSPGGRRARSPPSSGGCGASSASSRSIAGEQVLAAGRRSRPPSRRGGRRWRAAGTRKSVRGQPVAGERPVEQPRRCARRCLPQARSRSPLGVADEAGRRAAPRAAASAAAAEQLLRRRPARR